VPRRPNTRYAVVEGHHIGYQILGGGPVDVVLMHQWFTNVDAMWDLPTLASFVEDVASFARVLVFDKRGTGVSDAADAHDGDFLTPFRDDLRGLLDAVGFSRPSFIAGDSASMLAIDFAAHHPERVAALVIVDGFAHRPGDQEGRVHSHIDLVRRMFIDGEGVDLLAPSLADDPSFVQSMARYFRLSASPGDASETRRRLLGVDVRPLLPLVEAPTLVIHRTDNAFVAIGHGRELAASIPGARLVELDGADEMMIAGDRRQILDHVATFVAEAPARERTARPLRTVVFTDIVDSTRRAAELGDEAWVAELMEFRAAARLHLTRFDGREVNTRGDDLLATFTSPTRAIEYATSLRDTAAQLEMQVRSGLHFGEVEVVDTHDVGGIVVHVGARVAALARPGQVVVSRTVVDLVAGSSTRFVDLGSHELKGIEGTWQIFEVAP
jgi:class 3 adenylate cyclase